jgi:hypothetical protein
MNTHVRISHCITFISIMVISIMIISIVFISIMISIITIIIIIIHRNIWTERGKEGGRGVFVLLAPEGPKA